MGLTDKEIFGKDDDARIVLKGRSRINEDLVKRLLQEGRYTYVQIAKHPQVNCTPRHVRRIRDRLIENGELKEKESEKGPGIMAADFDDECFRAKGMSFLAYMKNKRKQWAYPFNFARRTWEKVWDKPNLVIVTDDKDPLGDVICQKFLTVMCADNTKSRDRKKLIRPLFTFLGREDLNNRHLTMTKGRDKISVKRIPHLDTLEFPILLDKALSAFRDRYGVVKYNKLRFKLCAGPRTGDLKEGRGWSGIRKLKKDETYNSYMLFTGPDEFQIHILEKMNEEWDINWLPKDVRHGVYEIYKDMEPGAAFITENYSPDTIRKEWYEVSEPILGFRLEFHDFRKVFATWLIICKVPMDSFGDFNVGWLDMNTLKDHYKHGRGKTKTWRKQYRENIPDWFKEGLEEWTEEM